MRVENQIERTIRIAQQRIAAVEVWMLLIDDELEEAGIDYGVGNESYEEAKAKLYKLMNWYADRRQRGNESN